MSKLLMSSAIVATTLTLMAPAPARAETYDKLAYLTFSGTVQVPGAILGAGTYRFHLTNPGTSRNVMQVLSYNGDVVYAMFNTIPDVRSRVTLDPVVTFQEVPEFVRPPIKAVFYGGETIGYEFLYPNGPDLTAMVIPQPPITYTYTGVVRRVPDAPPAPALEPPAAAAVAPPPPAEPAPPPAPAEIPKTATEVPAIGLGGFGLLMTGLLLGLARRHG
jgi:hypothetical protein